MKIHTTHPRIRHTGIKIDGKKPSGWVDGDDIPQIRHAADFNEFGNAEVTEATGKALIKAHVHIKEGHNKEAVAPEPDKED